MWQPQTDTPIVAALSESALALHSLDGSAAAAEKLRISFDTAVRRVGGGCWIPNFPDQLAVGLDQGIHCYDTRTGGCEIARSLSLVLSYLELWSQTLTQHIVAGLHGRSKEHTWTK